MTPPEKERKSVLLTRGGKLKPGKTARELVPILYEELRGLARKYFRHERHNHTLQPTALVHEAYLRLVDNTNLDVAGKTHFMAICARVMRQVLIDYARGKRRARRGGGAAVLTLESIVAPLDIENLGVIQLHEALEKLARVDPRQAQIVEMRFFGGLSVDEVARELGVSKRTAEGDWTHAKAWLRSELKESAGP